MGIFAISSKGSANRQRNLAASSSKTKKKKRDSLSRRQLIVHDKSNSSATEDDDGLSGASITSSSVETNNYRLKIKSKTTATPPKKTSFRKLEEFEFEAVSYIPPPDFNPSFGPAPSASSRSDKKSANKMERTHLKSEFAMFERFDSRSSAAGEDHDSSFSPYQPSPSQQPKTTTVPKSKTTTSTPLHNNSIKTNGKTRSITPGKKRNALVSSSGHQLPKNKKTPAFHLSSEYLPTRISPRKHKSRNKQLELVGSTDSSSICEYEPPPFLVEHKQVLSPKATFHFFEPEPMTDVSEQVGAHCTEAEKDDKNKEPAQSFVNKNTSKKPKKKIANGNSYQNETVVPEIDTQSSGEETFDVRSWKSSPFERKDVLVEQDSSSPNSNASGVSSIASPKGSDSTFRQIVFNESLDKIEQVAVAKSDNGASDFSDFVKAAAKLTQSFSKDLHNKRPAVADANKGSIERSPAKAKAALAAKNKKWPALKDAKGKDTPSNILQQQQQQQQQSTTSNNFLQPKKQPLLPATKLIASKDEAPSIAPPSASKLVASKKGATCVAHDSAAKSVSSKEEEKVKFIPASSGVKPGPTNDEIPFVAPSSLPWCRMKQYKGIAESSMTDSKEGSDGFSISSSQSSLPSKNRQVLREAIRAKAKTPLVQRSEPRSEKKNVQPQSPGALKSVDTGSMMGDCSVSNETFSKFPVMNDPFQSSKQNKNEIEEDPFKILDESIPDDDPFATTDPFHVAERENTFWDPTDDRFFQQKSKVSQPIAKQNDAAANKGSVKQTVSMDDGLIESIRKASTKATDPETDSRKRDPSPTTVRPSNSDGNIPYSSIESKKEDCTQPTASTVEPRPASPEKNVTKAGSSTKPSMALPANAILGSMLFRQTLATQFMDSSSATKKQQQQQLQDENRTLPLENQQQAKESKSQASKSSLYSDEHSSQVPKSVDTNDGDQSIVSSVTQEASSFYERSYGGSSGAKWNRQVQNMLNQFNARQALQSRVNSLTGHNENSAKQLSQVQTQEDSIKPSLSRSEEELVGMFRSEE